MTGDGKPRIPIEELFSSRGRVKVLKHLVEVQEINISELCRRVKLNHSTTRSHLDILIKSGLVEEKIFGRIKIYRFKTEDLRARALKSFLDLWKS